MERTVVLVVLVLVTVLHIGCDKAPPGGLDRQPNRFRSGSKNHCRSGTPDSLPSPACPLMSDAFRAGDSGAGHVRVNMFGDTTEELRSVGREVWETFTAQAHSETARARLDRIMESIRLPKRLHFNAPDVKNSRTCRLCNAVAGSIIHAIRTENRTGDALGALVLELCVRANVIAEHICKGLIESNTPILEYIVRNTPTLDGPFACGTFIPECGDGTPALDWVLARDMGAKPRGRIQNLMANLEPRSKAEPYRILQITDYHWDSEYAVGGNAECGEPTCCRRDQGAAANERAKAGRWGDYRLCDIPWDTVVEFMNHAKERIDLGEVDLIYFTGDIVDHGVWETSRRKNEQRIRDTFNAMKSVFGDVRVLPLAGNHEPHPLNVFAPSYVTDERFSSRWLYEILADVWISHKWLPEDTRETIMRGGYYTVLVKPGFRVVGLNNMYCYTLNWWVLFDPVDPSGQLAWLVDVLLAAEEAGEKVHILAHIPPGSEDCLHVWSREFARIVDRFSATIAAHFNGHTHVDDMNIFYDKNARPNNVAFNGGSLTTYADVNPNYKYYIIDGNHKDASWNVLDAELWGFNLTKANLRPDERPEWYKMYSFKEKFRVPSLHPVHLDKFVERLAVDSDLQQQYYWYHMLDSDVSHQTGCDNICVERLICNTVTTVTNRHEHCERFFRKRRSNRHVKINSPK